jgi:cytosine/uracil/thiamine/allantoin permease
VKAFVATGKKNYRKINFSKGLAIAPSFPGFLATLMELKSLPEWVVDIYDYAWFTSFVIAFPLYYILNRIFREQSYDILEEKHLNSVVCPTYS